MRDRASAPAHGDGTAAGSGAALRPGTSDVAPAAWHGTGPVDGGPPTSTAALLLVAAQGGGAAGVAYNVYTSIRLIRIDRHIGYTGFCNTPGLAVDAWTRPQTGPCMCGRSLYRL
jgi:hypothetical protein